MRLPVPTSVIFLLLAFCLSGRTTTSQAAAEPLTLRVSAGVGLKDVLQTLQKTYAEKQPDVRIEFNFAASGVLVKQIEQGAPVDLFLAPGRQHLQALIDAGSTDEMHSCALVGNDLALIVSREKANQIQGFSDLAGKAETLAIGQPEFVPVGRYAQEALTHLGLWKDLQSKVVFTKCVRQITVYVDSGNVDAGLVFSSETKLLSNGRVVTLAPADSHSPVVFSMAGIRGTKHPEALEALMAFLKSREAAAIFIDFGFRPLTGE
ncbi:MAG: molybdate ABC transporter substrate-binding protein [Syntrophotaleaceae bacterium]